MFAPHHYGQILLSDLGIVLWAAGIAAAIYYHGFVNVFTLYLVPYLW
jgi:omega-6 fatty acid desaturase (delta-12 desaturase)